MRAHLNRLSDEIWLIRIGEKFEVFGDPYEAVCTFIKTGPDSGRLVGLAGVFNKRSFLAIRESLISAGITKVEWERVKNSAVKHHNESI